MSVESTQPPEKTSFRKELEMSDEVEPEGVLVKVSVRKKMTGNRSEHTS